MSPLQPELLATTPSWCSHHASTTTACSRVGRRHEDLHLRHLLAQVQVEGPPLEARGDGPREASGVRLLTLRKEIRAEVPPGHSHVGRS
jgi:hypothetical protein